MVKECFLDKEFILLEVEILLLIKVWIKLLGWGILLDSFFWSIGNL